MLAIYQQRLNALEDRPIDATAQLASFNESFVNDSDAAKPIFRLPRVRVMYERLYGMMHYLNAYDGKGDQDWIPSLDEQRGTEETALAVMAKKIFIRVAIGHEAIEALTLMKLEIDLYPAPRNSSKHIASMKSLFFSIVRSSNGRVTKIPAWYGPPYHYINGNWIDRHHGDAETPAFIKRISLDSEGIHIFQNEVCRWYQMDSPYIAKLLAASHCSNPAILIQEQAESDLKTYLSNPANKSKSWSKLRDVALGLKQLKEYGTVHGNLKSSNILVGKDGVAKVSDFGGGIVSMQNLSLQHDNLYDEDKNEILKWRAPEYRSYRKRPTYQADVYSLGLCIVDILGSERSTAANNLVQQMLKDNSAERITLDDVISALDMLCH